MAGTQLVDCKCFQMFEAGYEGARLFYARCGWGGEDRVGGGHLGAWRVE